MSNYSAYRIGGPAPKQTDQILQHKYSKIPVNNSSQYLITSSTSFLTPGFSVLITPSNANNKIIIQFNTPMSYGRSGSKLTTRLKRTIGYTVDYPVIASYDNASSTPYSYGWSYTSRDYWQPEEYWHVDTTHNTTNEIKYEIQYAERVNSSAAYLGHQYMPIWLSATEIKA